jgi:hypothetical protein
MVELDSPRSEVELLVLRGVLDGAGFLCFVKNDQFGSLAVGPQIDHYNRKTIFIHEDQLEDARALLAEIRSRPAVEPTEPAPRPGLGDVLRMIVELLLFGWIVPGRRHHRSREPELRLIRGGDDGEPPDGDHS